MSLQRKIVQKLFESKGLYESEFQSGGSTYKCAFGRYYKDGEEITRDDYFKAKDGGSIEGSSINTEDSKPHQDPEDVKSMDLSIDKKSIDISDIEGAHRTKDGPGVLFDDAKGALKYEKRIGQELRKRNGITTDTEAEEFCNTLKRKIIDDAKKSGRLNTRSDEYDALVSIASTLKGHTIGKYGMTSAYVDIKKKSPYSIDSMQRELENN